MRYLVVLALAGCAGTWRHATKDEQQFHEDAYRCEQAASGQSMLGDRMQLFDRCMRASGWRN